MTAPSGAQAIPPREHPWSAIGSRTSERRGVFPSNDAHRSERRGVFPSNDAHRHAPRPVHAIRQDRYIDHGEISAMRMRCGRSAAPSSANDFEAAALLMEGTKAILLFA